MAIKLFTTLAATTAMMLISCDRPANHLQPLSPAQVAQMQELREAPSGSILEFKDGHFDVDCGFGTGTRNRGKIITVTKDSDVHFCGYAASQARGNTPEEIVRKGISIYAPDSPLFQPVVLEMFKRTYLRAPQIDDDD